MHALSSLPRRSLINSMSRRPRLSQKKGAERKITLLNKAQVLVQGEPTSEEPKVFLQFQRKFNVVCVLGNGQP